eukprot:CAMPEP_0204136044 /NCGR_PEP_ID=MMETSP0361-20130328/16605_1 /ASSEMBLY_ACC=CAM_ASM_000343 /TAXON_ID=268821 /ORGANISM="Scrippsiella Hangoei, Strain SHTV-5" /LENGTH=455 /DNA_ID=CAMNT_0051089505 /DNA_START=82 /DNA_END=1445 /DNA_ORIENTATION=+
MQTLPGAPSLVFPRCAGTGVQAGLVPALPCIGAAAHSSCGSTWTARLTDDIRFCRPVVLAVFVGMAAGVRRSARRRCLALRAVDNSVAVADRSLPSTSGVVKRRVAIEVGIFGTPFRSKLSRNLGFMIHEALMRTGVVPAGQKAILQLPEKVAIGAHARSTWVATSTLVLSASTIGADGSCKGLAAGLAHFLPEGVRLFQVVVLPEENPGEPELEFCEMCTAMEYRYYVPEAALGNDKDPGVEGRFRDELQRFVGTHCFANFSQLDRNDKLQKKLTESGKGNMWRDAFSAHVKQRAASISPGPRSGPRIPGVVRRMTTCKVRSIEVVREFFEGEGGGMLLSVRIVAEGFFDSMARLLVGSAAGVATGLVDAADLDEALLAEVVVDISEFAAPIKGLLLYTQHFDRERSSSWAPPPSTGTNEFFQEVLLPAVRKDWNNDLSLNLQARGSESVAAQL